MRGIHVAGVTYGCAGMRVCRTSSFPRPTTSFPRKREPVCCRALSIRDSSVKATVPSFPRKREPICCRPTPVIQRCLKAHNMGPRFRGDDGHMDPRFRGDDGHMGPRFRGDDGHMGPRFRGDDEWSAEMTATWVPAFAGMTSGVRDDGLRAVTDSRPARQVRVLTRRTAGYVCRTSRGVHRYRGLSL